MFVRWFSKLSGDLLPASALQAKQAKASPRSGRGGPRPRRDRERENVSTSLNEARRNRRSLSLFSGRELGERERCRSKKPVIAEGVGLIAYENKLRTKSQVLAIALTMSLQQEPGPAVGRLVVSEDEHRLRNVAVDEPKKSLRESDVNLEALPQ